MDDFATQLLAWFDIHGRHNLPWQKNATPYHVWLSEVMLQQTQVATVIPYFQKFTAAFPTVHLLAGAETDAVLHLWSGLGYYARGRNLHRAAQMVVEDFGGDFPADIDVLQSLPGVGRSTAGAILSIALGGRAPILDGNVKRVLARFHTVNGWPGQSATAKQLWQLAEQHTPQNRVADYTQAIMDLGATLCTRARPACAACPLQADCAARKTGTQTDFPAKKPARAVPTRSTTFALVCTPDAELGLERRPPEGIWGGLWCFPQFESPHEARSFCEEKLQCEILEERPLPGIRHAFSHYRLEISPVLFKLARSPAVIAENAGLRYWPASTSPRVGLAAPVKKLWQAVAAELEDTGNQPRITK